MPKGEFTLWVFTITITTLMNTNEGERDVLVTFSFSETSSNRIKSKRFGLNSVDESLIESTVDGTPSVFDTGRASHWPFVCELPAFPNRDRTVSSNPMLRNGSQLAH